MNDAAPITPTILTTLTALSQATRLAVFIRLAAGLPDGLASGRIASDLGTTAGSMSTHLAILSQAGLVRAERIGRSVIYRALPRRVLDACDLLEGACPPAGRPRAALSRAPSPRMRGAIGVAGEGGRGDAWPARWHASKVRLATSGRVADGVQRRSVLIMRSPPTAIAGRSARHCGGD